MGWNNQVAPAPTPDITHLPVSPEQMSDYTNPIRRLGQYFAQGLIFTRFSMILEVLTFLLGVPASLLMILYPVASVGLVMGGGLKRALQWGVVRWWLAFLAWLVIATPFSHWVGGSIELLSQFLKGAMMMLLISAGSFMGWRECRRALSCMAAGSIVMIYVGQKFNAAAGGRVSLGFGTIGNSNDLACHLLLCLPMLLFVLTNSKAKTIFRVATLFLVAANFYIILGSASRGALLSLCVMVTFYLLFAPGRQRLLLIPVLMVGGLVAAFLVPQNALNRLASLFSSTVTAESEEAQQSSARREMMLQNAIVFLKRSPLVGVGPAQFSNYNGHYGKEIGQATYWQNAHNSYLQAAAESGIPGFLLYCGGMFGTMLLLWRTHRSVCKEPTLNELAMATFYLLMGFIGFALAILFLNFTYLFHAPTVSGLAVALAAAAQWELRKLQQTRLGMAVAPATGAAAAALPRMGPAAAMPVPPPATARPVSPFAPGQPRGGMVKRDLPGRYQRPS